MEVQEGAGAGENRRVWEETQGENSPARGTNLSNSYETSEIVKKYLELFFVCIRSCFPEAFGIFQGLPLWSLHVPSGVLLDYFISSAQSHTHLS